MLRIAQGVDRLARLHGGQAGREAGTEAGVKSVVEAREERQARSWPPGPARCVRRRGRDGRSPHVLAQPQGRRRGAVRDLTADVVVLGGGLAGCTARALPRRGGPPRRPRRARRIGAARRPGRNGGFLFRQPAALDQRRSSPSRRRSTRSSGDGPGPLRLPRRARCSCSPPRRPSSTRAREYADALGAEPSTTRAPIPGSRTTSPAASSSTAATCSTRSARRARWPRRPAARAPSSARLRGQADPRRGRPRDRARHRRRPDRDRARHRRDRPARRFLLRSVRRRPPDRVHARLAPRDRPRREPPPYAIEQARLADAGRDGRRSPPTARSASSPPRRRRARASSRSSSARARRRPAA